MREILFRGKRVDNGEWVEGFLVNATWYLDETPMTVIIPKDVVFYPHSELEAYDIVIPETVGQFTGRTDNNGKRIFEGDILRQWNSRAVVAAEIANCGCCNDVYGFSFRDKDGDITDSVTFYNGVVIGNIHDNPELLTA